MDATVLADASVSLQRMLESAVKAVFSTATVSLDSPKDAKPTTPGDATVSLWLYLVTRHGDLVNQPPRRLAADRLEGPRLPVTLHYLATPLGADTMTRQRLLGIVMQAMHANAVVSADRLEAPLVAAGVGALRAHLEIQTLDQQSRIWYALSEPYQLSCVYLVDVVPLPPASEAIAAAPVLERRVAYSAIASVGPAGP